MKPVVISARARLDIDGIAGYTTSTWGARQTERYLGELEDAFELLARNPSIGRPCNEVDSELRRFEVARHVVFFRIRKGGIRIVRVLHQRMIPARWRF